MTIAEDRTIFRAICLDCLRSVIEKYSLSLESASGAISSTGIDEQSIKVLLRNQTTGLSFQTITHGRELGVTLYRLIDRKALETRGNGYGLDWIILLRNPKLMVSSNLAIPYSILKSPKNATGIEADKIIKAYTIETYTNLFQKYAKAVEVCASDVMEGDFSIFAELANMSVTQWQQLYEQLDYVDEVARAV